MNTHHDAAIESGEVVYDRSSGYQVGSSLIAGAEVDRWRKLAAIPEARDAIDRAMQRKPGNAEGVNQHTKELGTFDNVQDSKAQTGNAKDAALRRLRKAGLLLAAMDGTHKARPKKNGNNELPNLADLGISKMQSHRWQGGCWPLLVHDVGRVRWRAVGYGPR